MIWITFDPFCAVWRNKAYEGPPHLHSFPETVGIIHLMLSNQQLHSNWITLKATPMFLKPWTTKYSPINYISVAVFSDRRKRRRYAQQPHKERLLIFFWWVRNLRVKKDTDMAPHTLQSFFHDTAIPLSWSEEMAQNYTERTSIRYLNKSQLIQHSLMQTSVIDLILDIH